MEEEANIIYVLEVLDKTDNWIPVSSTMDEVKANQALKDAFAKGWDTTNARLTHSKFEMPAKPYRQE